MSSSSYLRLYYTSYTKIVGSSPQLIVSLWASQAFCIFTFWLLSECKNRGRRSGNFTIWSMAQTTSLCHHNSSLQSIHAFCARAPSESYTEHMKHSEAITAIHPSVVICYPSLSGYMLRTWICFWGGTPTSSLELFWFLRFSVAVDKNVLQITMVRFPSPMQNQGEGLGNLAITEGLGMWSSSPH